jgi:hypothetical protein
MVLEVGNLRIDPYAKTSGYYPKIQKSFTYILMYLRTNIMSITLILKFVTNDFLNIYWYLCGLAFFTKIKF